MFFPEAHVRVWLYTRPTDMRKSYDGLSALVKQALHEDPTNGHLFVFINRKRTQTPCVRVVVAFIFLVIVIQGAASE